MLPEAIDPLGGPDHACHLSEKWKIAPELALRLMLLAEGLPFGLLIISGYRTPERQRQLLAEPDSLAAEVDRSTHTTCPATGADLWTAITPTREVKSIFGAQVRIAGLRWGGGSPVDPNTGIPKDWNHVDLGPRAAR